MKPLPNLSKFTEPKYSQLKQPHAEWFFVPSPDLSIPSPSEIPKASLEGMKRALVVHGCEGLDELSIAGPSKVANRDGAHERWEVNALDRWFTHSELIFHSRNPSHIDVLWCFMTVNLPDTLCVCQSHQCNCQKKSLFIFWLSGFLVNLYLPPWHHG